jgi:hypothetical protein
MLNEKSTKEKGIASEVPTGALAIVLPLDYSAEASNTSTKNLVVTGNIRDTEQAWLRITWPKCVCLCCDSVTLFSSLRSSNECLHPCDYLTLARTLEHNLKVSTYNIMQM